jgi:hypothetical protein
MILPVLLSLLTVADRRARRPVTIAALLTAAVVIAMPHLHGDSVSLLPYLAPRLIGVASSVALGRYLRSRRRAKMLAYSQPPVLVNRSSSRG